MQDIIENVDYAVQYTDMLRVVTIDRDTVYITV